MNNILNYWYEMEFFNPSWPIEKGDRKIINKQYPWPLKNKNPKEQITFDLYIGKAYTRDLLDWMIEKLNLSKDEKIEKDYSKCCLCAIKIDENGLYVPESFAVSSFVWAICEFVTNGYGVTLDKKKLIELQSNIDKKLIGSRIDYKYSIYDDIFIKVCDIIFLDQKLIEYSVWAKRKVNKAIKINSEEYIFPPILPTTEIISSYYINDIKKIIDSPNEIIKQYVCALKSKNDINRIEIDINTDEMNKCLQAEKYPLGMWPSPYHPCLMQQIGINLAISNEQSIFSVNGPPGTGKTTLLKEVIVSNIIQRATVMSGFSDPDNAFIKRKFINPIDEYNRNYYELDENLKKYGIVVASNNNAAVENISVDLPKCIKSDRTGYFSKQNGKDIYFSDIASQLTSIPSWGLISAKLGKKDNIRNLSFVLNNNHKYHNGFLDLYEKAEIIPDWEIEKNKFNELLIKVLNKQKEIAYFQSEVDRYKELKYNLEIINQEYLTSLEAVNNCKNEINTINDEIKKLELLKENKEKNIDYITNELSYLKKIFWKLFKNNSLIAEWKSTEEEISKILLKVIKQNDLLLEKKILLSDLVKKSDNCKINLDEQKKLCNNLNEKIKNYKTAYGIKITDESFWNDISKNKNSQETSPWTYNEYDKIREELFYQSLMLHKAFILNSNGVKQNIRRLLNLWGDKFSKNDKKLAYSNLLNTLLLVIPVISTTFASVETFLENIGTEELGLLIIDEAGQATPQSALGAIWRSKKTIIVGDPLQVEPIVTIPRELQIRLADKYNIEPHYRVPELSVQSLADSLNKYGGYRQIDGEKIWLGCPLVLHRRCLDPMFSISNKVAYNDRMFQKTEKPDEKVKLFFSQSYWLDVKGKMKEKGNQNVKEQNDAFASLFEDIVKRSNNLPDLYIITPFKKIKDELKKIINKIIRKSKPNIEEKEIADWTDSHCGTIHTFQGKEANEVVLVLGCDSSIGKNSALWVGKKPNIINVAVSRAKYNICIIGDYEQWSKIPNVNIVCRYLKPHSTIFPLD